MGFANTTNKIGKTYAFLKLFPFFIIALIGVGIGIKLFFKTDNYVKITGVTTAVEKTPCPTAMRSVQVPIGQEVTYVGGKRRVTKKYKYEDRQFHNCSRTITYTVNDKEYETTYPTSTETPQDRLGEKIVVWYDKTQPNVSKFSHIPSKKLGMYIGIPFTFILLLVIGNLFFVAKVKHAGTGMMAMNALSRYRRDRY